MAKQAKSRINFSRNDISTGSEDKKEAQHFENGDYDEKAEVILSKRSGLMEKLKGIIYKEGTYSEITPSASTIIEKRIDDMKKIQQSIGVVNAKQTK